MSEQKLKQHQIYAHDKPVKSISMNVETMLSFDEDPLQMDCQAGAVPQK